MIGEDKRLTQGWFSRRNKTGEKFGEYCENKEEREIAWLDTMRENEAARAKRSPKQQIDLLDTRLGKGKGAKKERARLALIISSSSS